MMHGLLRGVSLATVLLGVAALAPAQVLVSTVAGSGTAGRLDGPAATAQFNLPSAVAVDAQGVVYVADGLNHAIRRIAPDGTVSTIGGIGGANYNDAPLGTLAAFNFPQGIAVDAQGRVYVADSGNGSLRLMLPTGPVRTLAGNGTGGYQDGPGPQARFTGPSGLVLDDQGTAYVADAGDLRIRRTDSTGLTSTLAGTGVRGFLDGPAASARFMEPQGIARDAAGNLYIADRAAHRIRRLSPAGTVSTVAGTGTAGYQDGPAATARFNGPVGLAYDGRGSLYIAEREGHRLRRLDLLNGTVSTVAGTGTAGYQDGPGAGAMFRFPAGLYWSALQNALYVADAAGHRIRKLTGLPLSSGQTGNVRAAYQLNVYPNPAQHELTIQLPAPAGETAAVEVRSVAGRVVRAQRVGLDARQQLQVNLVGLPAGLYLYRVQTPAGVYQGKFTKLD